MDMIETDAPDARARVRKAGKAPMRDWVPGYTLRDAWHPLAHSESVGKHPVKRLVHSSPFYLWRDDRNLPHATEYHPARPEMRKLATELTAGSGEYPVIERFGYVWAWYGDPAHASEELLPDIPYLPRLGGLPWFMRSTTRFDACAELSLENLIDLTHADYLHTNLTGDEECDSDTVEVESTSETITMIRTQIRKKTPRFLKRVGVKDDFVDFRGVIHIYLRSCVAHAFGRFTPGFTVPLFHPCVPESRFQNRLNVTVNTSEHPSPFKYLMPAQTYQVSPQDNYVTRPQNLRYMEATERRDLHSRFDTPGTKYRYLMQQLAERQRNGDYAYAADHGVGQDLCELFRIERVPDRA